MRIVIDTKSKGWDTFKRVLRGVLILILFFTVMGFVKRYTGWDTDFHEGFISAYFIVFYNWTK